MNNSGDNKRILLVLGEPFVINFDQAIIHHLNEPRQAVSFAELEEKGGAKALRIELGSEQLEHYKKKFGKEDANIEIVFSPGYLDSGVKWHEFTQVKLFNQKYQDIAKILSAAQSSRFLLNIPPTLTIYKKEWLVEGYNNLLRQVNNPYNVLHGFDQRKGLNEEHYFMFDKETYSAPKSGWQEKIYSIEDCDRYERIIVNDSIAKMDPVGRAQREGKPWGFYCMNCDFMMKYQSFPLFLFGDYIERIIDENRLREGMRPFNHHPSERIIPRMIASTSTELKHETIKEQKEKKRKSQGRKS